MTETAETTLGVLRRMVDDDPMSDPLMTKAVEEAVGYKDSMPVFITVDGRDVAYLIRKERMHVLVIKPDGWSAYCECGKWKCYDKIRRTIEEWADLYARHAEGHE